MAGVRTDARSGVLLWPEGGHDQPLAGGRRDWVPHHGKERWQGSAPTQGRGSNSGQKGGTTSPWPVGAGTGFHTTEGEMAGVHTDARSGVHAGLDTVARA